MWILGGWSGSVGSEKNDSWSSSDGISWENKTNSESQLQYTARRAFGCTLFNSKTYILGGIIG